MRELIGLLFSGLPRFRELNETSHLSCSKSCSEILGYLPDGNTVREVVDFYQNTVNETDNNRTIENKYDYEKYAYLGVTYDFREGLWLNDYDDSPFDDSLWLRLSLSC